MLCGVGDYSARLATALREAGVDLHVLTTRLQGPRLEEDPPWVHRKMPFWTSRAYPEFREALEMIKPDLVHVQYPSQGYDYATAPAILMLMARLRRRFAIVSTWHEYPPERLTKGKICQLILALISRAIVVVRPAYSARVLGILSIALGDNPICFIPNSSVIPRVTVTEDEKTVLIRDFASGQRKIVTFFGFAYPHKGVEQIFEIANPTQHHLLLIGNLTQTDPYHVELRRLADSERWRGRVTITGYVDPLVAARYLAVSDAVVFPFTGGGGSWNSSLHAVTEQGTFAIVTSTARSGYDDKDSVYYAAPGDVPEMAAALCSHAGTKLSRVRKGGAWEDIAREHIDLYRKCLV